MKTSLALVALCLLLLPTSPAFARGTVFHGEYQRVENGSTRHKHAAQIITMNRGTPHKPNVFRCHFEDAGKKRTIVFQIAQCLRRGTHVLCSNQTDRPSETKRGCTGDVCWGDIYLKPAPK